MAKKHSRRHSKKHRTQRRKHSRRRAQRGGESAPGSVNADMMKPMMNQSLAQGQQFANMHANQHGGGGLDAGPFPGAVTEQSMLPQNLHAAARIAPLNAALGAIANMKDPGQAGGGGCGLKGGNIVCDDWEAQGFESKADCLESQRGGKRKARKSRKGRKASKKARKASRKSRKGRKTRRGKQRGGAAYDSNPAPFGGPSMLLSGSQMSKALSGMNSEWKLAENPSAFAPGVRS